MADPSSSTLTRYHADITDSEAGFEWLAAEVHLAGDVAHLLAFQDAEIARLRKENAILTLAVPLEDELVDRIDETLKYLAMGQGFTLTGIARLLSDVNRRLSADWLDVGRERRQRNQLSARLALVTEALQSIANNSCCGPCQEAKRVAQRALCQADRAVDGR